MVPEISRVTERFFFVILDHFLHPNNPKNQNFEKMKNYTSVPKIMIICYTVPKIWRVTDVIVTFSFWAIFCPFSPLTAQKIKI